MRTGKFVNYLEHTRPPPICIQLARGVSLVELVDSGAASGPPGSQRTKHGLTAARSSIAGREHCWWFFLKRA